MDLISADIFTDSPGNDQREVVLHLFHRPQFIHIQGDHGPASAVQAQKSFLFQYSICLVDCMHVNSDLICKLSDRRETIPIVKHIHCDAADDLIAELGIECFFTVKIDLQYHLITIFFLNIFDAGTVYAFPVS